MARRSLPPPQPAVRWTESTGMVGGRATTALGAILAAVGAGATVVLNSEVQLSPAVLLGAAVIVAMVGTLGAALGIHTTRRRRAKGDDRRYTEPPIRRVRRDGLPSPSVLLVAGLLALGLSQQACAHNGVLEPPLSYGQGAHGAVVLSLSCEVARELLAPDSWIPVDDAAREMADRICSGVTTIGGALLAALSRPPAPSGPVATRTGAMEAEPPRYADAPELNVGLVVPRCVRPGLSEEARRVCGQVVVAAQEGADVLLVPQRE